MIFPGWIIARAIPYELLAGILMGKYKITGGVIRWAAGTPQAGQIIRHLLPAALPTVNDSVPGGNFITMYQLFNLSRQVTSVKQVTQHILNIVTGTAVLSGLNLLVSSLGFIVMNQKLNTIDDQLKTIRRDVQAIKTFLDIAERAKLYAALKELSNLDDMNEHRDPLLRGARTTLLEIHMKYKELLGKVTDRDHPLELAIAYEEYFSLTALALAHCSAELGLLKLATKERLINTCFANMTCSFTLAMIV